MNEIDKLQRAKMYIDKLANGINPITNSAVPENDSINNVRLSRCFFYVSDILGKVIENNGNIPSPKRHLYPFHITKLQIEKIQLSDIPIAASKIAERINEVIDTEKFKKLSYNNIADWLVSVGVLSMETNEEGKSRRLPTVLGNTIGITTETRVTAQGADYLAVLFDRNAQKFVVDNIDNIIKMVKENIKEK